MQYSVTSDYQRIDKNKWTDFILNHPHGNIFQSPELYEVYKQIPKFEPVIVVALADNSSVIGCLMAIIQKEYNGLIGNFTSRAIIMGGPLVKDDDIEIVDSLLKSYNKLISSKAIYSQFRNLCDMRFMKPVFEKNGYEYEEHLDIHNDLTQSEELISAGISKNKRGNISKTTNKGTKFIEVTDEEKFNECINLILATYSRVALPCPSHDFFIKFNSDLSGKGILKTFAAELDGKIIGTRMELCYKGMVYDWYAGADDNFKNRYPNDFLPYHILFWGKENGFSMFDFGGAGKPNVPYGVRDHKIKFGGALVEYGRFEKIHKQSVYNIAKAGFSLWQKLK